MRIGYSRLFAAFAVAYRPRNGACAARADAQRASGVQPCDGTAARTDGRDVQMGKLDGKTFNAAFSGNVGRPVLDHGDIKRRSAHVAGNQVLVRRHAGKELCGQYAAGRTGQ